MAEETPRTGIEVQIDQEAKELAAIPKIPVHFFGSNAFSRCHICGQVFSTHALRPYDTHVRGANRQACGDCHPGRGDRA